MLVSVECREDLVKDNIYIDCYESPLGRMNINNLAEKCVILVSEKCQKFNSDPLSVAPRCANDEVFQKILPEISLEQSQKNINCLLINDGEVCPTVKKNMRGSGFGKETIEETCKSAACTESFINNLEYNRNSTRESRLARMDSVTAASFDFDALYKELDETIAFLKSQECISQNKDDKATARYINAENYKEYKSGATIIKCTSGILFTTIGLMLTYLL